MNVFKRLIIVTGLFFLTSAIIAAGYIEKILFSTLDKYNKTQIFAVNPDGTGLSQITDEPGLGASNPCVSPDGTKIVFISSLQYGSSAIKVMNSDGSHLVNIYPASGYSNSLFLNPRFSINGNILYVLKSETDNKVLMELNMNTKGFSQKAILKSSSIRMTGNGDILSSTCIKSSIPDLYRSKSDGSNYNLVAKNAGSPDISYDGKLITFHRTEKFTDIYTIDGKGVETKLTDNKYCNYDPVFSPDANRIAFCSYGVEANPGSDFKISVMYKDGIGKRDIATGFHSRVNDTVWAKLSTNPPPETPDVPWNDEWKIVMNPPKPDIYASENKNTSEIGYNQFNDEQFITGFVKTRRINTFYIKVRNSGDVAVPFIIKGTATGLNGWTLKMMDENNTVITRAVTSTEGLTTPVIAAGKSYKFRLETSPASTLKDDAVINVVLTVYSSIDSTVNDKITVRTTKE
jgi:hypothetical protein